MPISGFTSAFQLCRICVTLWHENEYRCLSLPVSGCFPPVLVPVAQFCKEHAAWITKMLKQDEGSQAYVYPRGKKIVRSCCSPLCTISESSLPVKVTCWSRSCAAPAPLHFVSLLAWGCSQHLMNTAILSWVHQTLTAAFTVCSHLVRMSYVTLEPWSHTTMLIGLELQFLRKKIISLDKMFLLLWRLRALYPNTAVGGGSGRGSTLFLTIFLSMHVVQWCLKAFPSFISALLSDIILPPV